MIEKIVLKNFQVHEKVVLDLNHPITTITGASDTGKSAILRALLWLATNRPTGTQFIRHGTEAAVVSVTVDGTTIKRKRNKTENTYQISTHELKAMGAAVPEPVATALNLRDVNVQRQHDAPFWLSLSAGQVASDLYEIINLGVLDSSIAYLSKSKRNAQIVKTDVWNRSLESTAALDALDFVPELIKRFEALQGLQVTIDAKDAKREALAGIVVGLDAGAESIGLAKAKLSDATRLLGVSKRAVDAGAKVYRLSLLLGRIKTAHRYPATYPKDVQELSEWISSCRALLKRHDNLSHFLSLIDEEDNRKCRLKRQLEKARARMKDTMKGTCPLCGGRVKQP